MLVLPLQATDYYVTKSGNDSNAGTSKSAAWLTIGKANETLTAGDVVHVYAGVYADTINPSNSGTASEYITYLAEEDSVILYDSDGTNSARNIILNGTVGTPRHHIIIDGFILTGYSYTTYIRYAHSIIIRNCIMKTGDDAKFIDAGFWVHTEAHNVSIEGCMMAIRGSASSFGRFVYARGDTIYIRNNTFVKDNVDYCGVEILSEASYVTIEDNIFLSSASNTNSAVEADAGAAATCTVGINYYWNFTEFSDNLTDTSAVVKADPLLWESTYSNLSLYTSDYHKDFKLRNTSPCIGTASNGLEVGAEPNIIFYLRNE